MKIRNGFVSNSSSTVYIITNRTFVDVDLVQFVKENPQVVDEWNDVYGEYEQQRCKVDDLVKVAEQKNIIWKPGERKVLEFGDHDGTYAYTPLGVVFDYCLRSGGKSKSFEWKFLEFNR